MYIGFDTSNYTTSVALLDENHIIQKKKLLSVKPGERGLRQSDAVFQHSVHLPVLVEELKPYIGHIEAVGVSVRPRNVSGSYMPCFLAGQSAAAAAAVFTQSSLYTTSHQVGHILAALYSAGCLDLISQRFIAFHISGGTTEALLVQPDEAEIIRADCIARSTDLKAGQAIDRTGIMLGMQFPCGIELDALSLKSHADFSFQPSLNGLDCSLSGVENKVKSMLDCGTYSREDIARFAILCICRTLEKMTERIMQKYAGLPLLFSGGVTSNTLIRQSLSERFGAIFAQPEFSCDNAAGSAIYAYLKTRKNV